MTVRLDVGLDIGNSFSEGMGMQWHSCPWGWWSHLEAFRSRGDVALMDMG